MGKRKDLSEFDKGQIVVARRLDQSISKTAALVGCSRSAVVSIYQKWSKEGTVVNRQQGHGRSGLIGERRLARVIRSNRRATVAQIAEELNTGSDRKVSEYTVHDSTPLTVLGDFNLPSDKLHSSGLLALLNSFSLSFNSCPPTHKEGNVLDLVFTHPSPATDMTVTPLHISDHHLVSFTITLPVLPKRNSQHLSLTRRNLHSISPSSVASCTLSSLPDHESFSSLPLDSATDTLLSSLSSTMDLLCPLSTIRKKNSSTAPWLTDVLCNNRRELRSAARKWKKSKLDTDLISYRTLLSKFSLDMTSAKTSFYKEKLENSAQDPRKLHNIFLSLLNPPAPPSPSSLTAEDFATFYTENIERICQTFTSLPTSPTSHSQHSATPSLTQLSTVASEEVLRITRSCNPTTCPLDPIPSAMLQTISPDLLPFITTVINGSLMSGHVPTAFKKARVIPILKKPALDPSDISNYRPVSLLSFLSKILERVVYNQLSDYLMQNNLHDPNQSGFKAAHSTETDLLAVTEKLHAARSAKLSSVLILLDLSAAFDTVNHKTLLSTLRSLGICGTAWEWFASYLDGRSYQVIHPQPQDLAISLSNSMISPSATARNLGVTMDNQLSFSSHVTNVTRSCRFLLYNIRRIRPFLSTQATQVLVQSLVISRLDYCNSLLAGLPLNAICPLQMIQNAAARLVFNLPKFSHTTPLLRSLHWLPVAARIRFKTLMLAYKAKNGPAPSYLKAPITPRTAPRSLRSTSTARLVPPSLREKGRYTSRLFSVLAPRWWNKLPLGIRTAESLTVFKRQLKTHLFLNRNAHVFGRRVTPLHLPVSGVPCPLSCVRCLLSRVRCPLSHVRCPLSCALVSLAPVSGVPCPVPWCPLPLCPGVPCPGAPCFPVSLVLCPVSLVLCSVPLCPVSLVLCLVSLVPCPVSGVPCPVSGVPCPVFGVPCPVSRVRCPLSCVPCPV
ncbi:hypothetical protein QTP86_013117 [Hemibagrus guttatus]|nr:hypothetical protein QTP86_013117 [Hemibagrus guttatus]